MSGIMRTLLAVVGFLALATPGAAAEAGGIKGTVTVGGSRQPLAGAVVMIDAPPQSAAAGAPHVVVDQRDDTFVPHVTAVAVGTTVDFGNSDPRLHNVYSGSQANRFDLGMFGQGKSKSVTFDKPGVVRVLCNVHPKMEAFVVVHTSPYVAVTDAQGIYTVANVPPGSYAVRVWHESHPERQLTVTIRAGQIQPLDANLAAR